MKTKQWIPAFLIVLISAFGCSKAYKDQPISFQMPSAYDNATKIGDALVGAKVFVDKEEAQEAFGFDIRGAGMLPVQIIFDNQGSESLEIIGSQTFLEDEAGNLWPLLSFRAAYERAAEHSKSNRMLQEGAYHGIWGAATGALVGAAIGIISGDNVGAAMGKGAAGGAAAGAVIGSVKGYDSVEARRKISSDLREKSLENKAIDPLSIAHGFLFFPGEAVSAEKIRMQIKEKETGKIHLLHLFF